MLILSRRLGEQIVIPAKNPDESIFITVLGTKGNQVRLGVQAHKDQPVHRYEIYQRILGEENHEQN